jgi:aryl-alcohol dehydrogenase-like predicted oxidoreductase
MKEINMIVFARSVFLQGLFFLDENKLPETLEIAREPLKRLHQLILDYGTSTAELALKFVRDLPGVTSVIIGAETPQQVIINAELMKSPALPASLKDQILSVFSNMPLEIIIPSLWRLK